MFVFGEKLQIFKVLLGENVKLVFSVVQIKTKAARFWVILLSLIVFAAVHILLTIVSDRIDIHVQLFTIKNILHCHGKAPELITGTLWYTSIFLLG